MRTQAVQEVFIEIRDLQREEGWGMKRMIRMGFQLLWGSGDCEEGGGYDRATQPWSPQRGFVLL